MRLLTAMECKEFSGRWDWKRQLTCQTPRKRLLWFSTLLVEHLMPFESAMLIAEPLTNVVPPELDAIRRATGDPRSTVEAPGLLFEGEPELFRAALVASLSGWID